MNVVDASVLVELLAAGKHREAAEEAIGREPWVWSPALIDAEVGHALRGLVLRGEISARKAGDALGDLFKMRLQKVPHKHLVGRAWQLRDNVSFYDGLYVALAEAVGSPLVTRDARLARTSGLRTEVELIGAA